LPTADGLPVAHRDLRNDAADLEAELHLVARGEYAGAGDRLGAAVVRDWRDPHGVHGFPCGAWLRVGILARGEGKDRDDESAIGEHWNALVVCWQFRFRHRQRQ
jgi:hypothetical protein